MNTKKIHLALLAAITLLGCGGTAATEPSPSTDTAGAETSRAETSVEDTSTETSSTDASATTATRTSRSSRRPRVCPW